MATLYVSLVQKLIYVASRSGHRHLPLSFDTDFQTSSEPSKDHSNSYVVSMVPLLQLQRGTTSAAV